jgi:hypothetical protein
MSGGKAMDQKFQSEYLSINGAYAIVALVSALISRSERPSVDGPCALASTRQFPGGFAKRADVRTPVFAFLSEWFS